MFRKSQNAARTEIFAWSDVLQADSSCHASVALNSEEKKGQNTFFSRVDVSSQCEGNVINALNCHKDDSCLLQFCSMQKKCSHFSRAPFYARPPDTFFLSSRTSQAACQLQN